MTLKRLQIMLLLLPGTLLVAGDNRKIVTIDELLADEVEVMEIDIEFGFGKIQVERGNPAKAVTGYIEYDEDYLRPEFDYRVKGKTARFRFRTKIFRDGWKFDLGRHGMDSPDSEIYFTTRVPLEIEFACGLGEAHIDLGDLQVADFELDNGLGETTLDFSTLNRIELDRLNVENGLGELVARSLSNARTGRMEFNCGLGEADLDFSGEELRDISVDVNVGLGSITLRIPEAYSVELRAGHNFLSSIDTHGMVQVRKDLHRTRDFDDDGPTLYIDASVGLGSLDIKWID